MLTQQPVAPFQLGPAILGGVSVYGPAKGEQHGTNAAEDPTDYQGTVKAC